MAAKTSSYQEMNAELAEILLDLQQENVDVDQAMQKYERGLALVTELEKYLKTAENKITKLKPPLKD